jgi:uncharacterized membrane protein
MFDLFFRCMHFWVPFFVMFLLGGRVSCLVPLAAVVELLSLNCIFLVALPVLSAFFY